MTEEIIHSLEKRFQTIIIGSLSRIEESFGFLWDNDQEDRGRESRYREIWKNLREDILDHGNYQLRLAIRDLEKDIRDRSEHFKYQYHFLINKGTKDDNR